MERQDRVRTKVYPSPARLARELESESEVSIRKKTRSNALNLATIQELVRRKGPNSPPKRFKITPSGTFVFGRWFSHKRQAKSSVFWRLWNCHVDSNSLNCLDLFDTTPWEGQR
jgi:hypothetical protein